VSAEGATRILVVQTAFPGDLVLATPLFRGLRRLYPEATLTALVSARAAPLVEEDPFLDGLLVYDKTGGESFASAVAKVRRGRFDALISPHRSHRSSLLALLSGARIRVGFSGAGFPWAYTRRVRREAEHHEVDRNLSLLRGLGSAAVAEDRVLSVGYTEAEAARVRGVLAESGVGPDQPLVALAPGSVWATKRWNPEGFAAVGRALVAGGDRVVLLGGEDDVEVCRTVARGIGEGAVVAAGRTPLKALPAWLDRVRLLLTNDSAPLHVAAARGTPAVAVFGATTPGLGFSPFHDRSRVLEVDLPCRPCGPHGGRRCPLGHLRCLEEIRPEAVLAACRELSEG